MGQETKVSLIIFHELLFVLEGERAGSAHDIGIGRKGSDTLAETLSYFTYLTSNLLKGCCII
jgi:hypothetical protein